MSNSEYESVTNQLLKIPGVSKREAEAAARILVFVDPIRRRTSTEQSLIERLWAKRFDLEKDLQADCIACTDRLADFIQFIQTRDSSLYYPEATKVAGAAIRDLPYLVAESPELSKYLDNAILAEKSKR